MAVTLSSTQGSQCVFQRGCDHASVLADGGFDFQGSYGRQTLNFTTTAVTGTFSPGSYTANVHFKVSGYGDYVLPFTLAVIRSCADPQRSKRGTTQSLTWSVGTTLPSNVDCGRVQRRAD